MGILDRILAVFRSDSLSVSTDLDSDTASPGDRIEAAVDLSAGDERQRVEAVRLTVEAYDPERDEGETVVDHAVTGGLTIEPGEKRTVTTAFDLPEDTPVHPESSMMVLTLVETGGELREKDMSVLHFEEPP